MENSSGSSAPFAFGRSLCGHPEELQPGEQDPACERHLPNDRVLGVCEPFPSAQAPLLSKGCSWRSLWLQGCVPL